MSAGIHALDSLTAGDLVFTIAPPTGRTTLEITVDRDASLVLRAPSCASRERVDRFIESKRGWVYRKLAEKDALVGPPINKQFVDGEGFAYLGRSHKLEVVDYGDDVRLDRGRFMMPAALVVDGPSAMRRWYRRSGAAWLARRAQPWCARMGHTDVDVVVSELGYRWGSARPLDGANRINIHWVTMQLPPSLIDYVIVHELAHLEEPNHTPEYWSIVQRVMPGYELQKASLAGIGKNVWMG